MEMRRAGMVFVAAATLVLLLAFAAFAQTASATVGTGQAAASATVTTGTPTAPTAVCPPGTAAPVAQTCPPAPAAACAPVATACPPAPVANCPTVTPINDYASCWNSGGAASYYTGRVAYVTDYYPAGAGTCPGTEVTLWMDPMVDDSIPDWQLNEQPPYRTVQLGPSWYVQQHLGKVRPGDIVTVRGVPVYCNGDRFIIARNAWIGGRYIVVSNDQGCPMWAGGWPNWGQGTTAMAMATAGTAPVVVGSAYNPASVQTITGSIQHVWNAEPVAGMGRMQMFSILQPSNAVINVAVAPASFVSQSAIPLRLGDQVTVTGSLVNAPAGPLLLASQIQENGRQYTFRDQSGNPAWATAAAAGAPAASATATVGG